MSRLSFAASIVVAAAAVPTALSAQSPPPAPVTPKPRHETQAQLQKEAKVALADATTTALKEVPGGKVSGHELEREKGKLIYSFDIKVTGKTGIEEVNVDAITGAMVDHTHEAH